MASYSRGLEKSPGVRWQKSIVTPDLDDCKREVIECKHIISDLQSQLNHARLEIENIKKDKLTLEEQIKRQHVHLSRQREKVSEAEKIAEEAKLGKSIKSKEQYLLELENQTFRDAVQELEENEEELVREIEKISNEHYALENKHRETCREKTNIQISLDEKAKDMLNLDREKGVLLGRLESRQEGVREWKL